MKDLVGKVIAGRFEVIRLIGQGGMGSVFEAKHRTLPRKFAIKVLRRDLARNPSFVERFRREAIAASRIEHPNVIYITDYGQEDKIVYLVMEYLEGMGLDEVLARNIRVPLNRTLPVLAQLADALDSAHRVDVVHRDLKPENILLTEDRGRKDVVKILDFGIAKMRSQEFSKEVLTMQGQVFGTAEYMSPEQATGEPTDGRSDIYSVGCLAYEMITGNPPFLGPPMRVLQAHVNLPVFPPSTKIKDFSVPSVIDAVVLRCLAKEPKDRYQTSGDLRKDLMKARGALLGISEEIVSRDSKGTGAFAATPRQALTSGWQSLGGRVPDIFSGLHSLNVLDEPEKPAGSLTSAGEAVQMSREDLREAYQEAVREVALALVQAAIASPEMSEALERLLVVEEEAASLTGTIALAEQNFDRIRFEYSEREKRLRAAILDLEMSRAQLRGRSEISPEHRDKLAAQVADLDYQIAELSKRCAEIGEECAAQIHELDVEVKQYHKARTARQQEGAELYHSLHERIESLRPKAVTDLSLQGCYQALDKVVTQLDSSGS